MWTLLSLSLSLPLKVITPPLWLPQRILKWVWYPRSHFPPRNSNRGFVKTRKVWEVEQSVTSSQTKQHLLSNIKPRGDEADDSQALVLFLAPIFTLVQGELEGGRKMFWQKLEVSDSSWKEHTSGWAHIVHKGTMTTKNTSLGKSVRIGPTFYRLVRWDCSCSLNSVCLLVNVI